MPSESSVVTGKEQLLLGRSFYAVSITGPLLLWTATLLRQLIRHRNRCVNRG